MGNLKDKGLTPMYTYQAGYAFHSLWWLVFMALSIGYMRPRPGPKFPETENAITFSFKKCKL